MLQEIAEEQAGNAGISGLAGQSARTTTAVHHGTAAQLQCVRAGHRQEQKEAEQMAAKKALKNMGC